MAAPKDISFALRKAYQTALTGDATLTSLVSDRIYDRVPADVQYPYVYYSDYQDDDTPSPKDSWVREANMKVTVISRFDGDDGGQKPNDAICDAIIQVIATHDDDHLDMSAQGFKMMSARHTGSSTFVKKSNIGAIYGRTLSFRHQVYQT